MIVDSGLRLAPILCLFGLTGALAGTACTDAAPGDDAAPDGEGPPVVAVPVVPMAGLVEAIAPPGALDVVVLVPPGANPATYEPALEELRRTAEARLYLALGHPAFVFERTWLDGLLGGSDAERVEPFVDCPVVEDDYHVWLSASCVGDAGRRVAGALRRIVPGAGAEIDERLAAFLQRVATTDSATRVRLEPHRGGAFVVLHPAWGYLARSYELEQLSILTHGTGDPGAGRVAELIDRARRSGTRRVFIQPQFNRAPARLVAEEIGAELVLLDPLQRDPLAAIDEVTMALARDFEERPTIEGSGR
ncbi:MAG: metal ABC transporter solute-binding protein, Zn/Mn family [Gemmatimonadota bacterium]